MDATIIVALLAGLFSLSGTAVQIRDKMRERRQNTATLAAAAEEVRAKRLDDRYEQLVERQERALQRSEARADELYDSLTALRARHSEALERTEMQGRALAAAQQRILELEDRAQGMRAG